MASKEENGQAGGPGVAVYQGLPDVEMVVAEGNFVSPAGDDKTYEGGERITVSGPDAISLAAAGHATPVEAEEG
jgi:hypothetical protein